MPSQLSPENLRLLSLYILALSNPVASASGGLGVPAAWSLHSPSVRSLPCSETRRKAATDRSRNINARQRAQHRIGQPQWRGYAH